MKPYSVQDPSLWDKLHLLPLRQSIWVSPTDTVLGLGCALSYNEGIQRIASFKKRQKTRFIVLVPNFQSATRLAIVSAEEKALLEEYWPGPITFILRQRDCDETIALRCPSHSFLQSFLKELNEPMISTSCNRTGELPLSSIQDAYRCFGNQIDLYIDGPTQSDPSTIVDLTQEPYQILRKGAVKFP